VLTERLGAGGEKWETCRLPREEYIGAPVSGRKKKKNQQVQRPRGRKVHNHKASETSEVGRRE
jgi:hypothetical protein